MTIWAEVVMNRQYNAPSANQKRSRTAAPIGSDLRLRQYDPDAVPRISTNLVIQAVACCCCRSINPKAGNSPAQSVKKLNTINFLVYPVTVTCLFKGNFINS